VSPLVHVKEPVLLDKIGLDAVAFLRFLRMMRWIFLAVSVLCCAVLIPINVSYNLKFVPEDSRDTLGILTLQNLSGSWLVAHVAMSYVINGIVLGFIYYNWKAMVALRWTWFRSDEYQKSFHARTLMVLGVVSPRAEARLMGHVLTNDVCTAPKETERSRHC
jgi:calcium permeable stress-gated cation channel